MASDSQGFPPGENPVEESNPLKAVNLGTEKGMGDDVGEVLNLEPESSLEPGEQNTRVVLQSSSPREAVTSTPIKTEENPATLPGGTLFEGDQNFGGIYNQNPQNELSGSDSSAQDKGGMLPSSIPDEEVNPGNKTGTTTVSGKLGDLSMIEKAEDSAFVSNKESLFDPNP